VPLRPQPGSSGADGWQLDPEEFAAAFSPRTRLVIVNTPQNPLGKVFGRAELELIARLAQEHDAYVLSDEVYEWMVYADANRGVEHVRIANLPGMWERTVTLGSAGKTFSVTGWKIGWAIAPAYLSQAIFMAHQWIPFAVATPLQEAVACALEQVEERNYFAWLSQMYTQKRDKLLNVLEEIGLKPVRPDGSYFILFQTGDLDVPFEPGTRRDYAVCRWFTRHVGVAAIPPSPFYSPPHQYLTDNLARFCFCKTDDMLDDAAQRLKTLLG
jgi:aspartate/methionine/tyrosine aminotransferase